MQGLDFSDIEKLKYKDNLLILQDFLNQTGKRIGQEIQFQCPLCMDRGKNNLSYNPHKQILKCFADETHTTQIIKEIRAFYKSADDKPTPKKKKSVSEPKETFLKSTSEIRLADTPEINALLNEKLVLYANDCNRELINDTKALKYLYNKRGITKETVLFTGIGIDRKRRKWTLPKYLYQTPNNTLSDTQIINCELRGVNLEKKEISTLTKKDFLEETQQKSNGENLSFPTALCQVNCYISGVTDTLFITEGFFDAYIELQICKEKKRDNFHIVTSSNGIGTLAEQIRYIDFEKYKYIILCVDNDEASRPKADAIYEELQKHHPNILKQEINCAECSLKDTCKTEKRCKDLNDRYLMKLKIKGQEQGEQICQNEK